MRFIRLAACSTLLAVSVVAFDLSSIAETLSAGDLRKSGTIRLDIRCKAEVREDFQTAVALLHSFFYEEARRRFEAIVERDPECAMAHWGVAMTWYHPLWSPPTPDEMAFGIAAVEKAKSLGGKTDLERGLIAAIDAFYRSADQPARKDAPLDMSCHGPRAHGARSQAFTDSMRALHEKFPDNTEVMVFYALSILGSSSPEDREYAAQLKATSILEPLMEKNPDHPGVAHYIIHSYDYPSLADRALVAARHYDDIAPWVPHALHMPTHIYTRLGMWPDSIEGNLASSAAARDYAARFHDGATIMDDLHALDYLMFAYLQTARDKEAKAVLEHVNSIERFASGNAFAGAYAVGAIPARYVLERRRWQDAANLPMHHASYLAPFPYAAAHIEFARALGAAHVGDLDRCRSSIARLTELKDQLKEPKFQWWINQVEIQTLAAKGWLAYTEKKPDEALRFLRASVELEDSAGTHPVTPGQILPAREQLADLLLELGRPDKALAAYEKALIDFPNRLNGHIGAARAAASAGKPDVAKSHYRKVLEMAGTSDGRRAEIRKAEAYLAVK